MSQFASFFINAFGDRQCDEINLFMKQHVIVRTVENLVSTPSNCGIQILVEYKDSEILQKKNGRVDWRSTLNRKRTAGF